MLTAAVLLAWCVLLAGPLPRRLYRASWARRSPRLAVGLWQALSVSFLVTASLAVVSVADPDNPPPNVLAHPMRSCLAATRDALHTPAGAVLVGGAVVLFAVLAGRVAWYVGSGSISAARRRRVHGLRLSLVARRDDDLGALIVEHAVPQAYCLPGRRATIVLTTATVAELPEAELAAVLAHERAHVRARHHLVVQAARGLERAFPRIPLFRYASAAVPALVEMAADDVAARRTDPRRVAAALATLSTSAAPPVALSAAGVETLSRVRRLLAPAPLGAGARTVALAAILAALALPLGVVALSSWGAHTIGACCEVSVDSTTTASDVSRPEIPARIAD
ncbi:MAG: M56 family metallopeptidase [Sporichthyaceae bacterium]